MCSKTLSGGVTVMLSVCSLTLASYCYTFLWASTITEWSSSDELISATEDKLQKMMYSWELFLSESQKHEVSTLNVRFYYDRTQNSCDFITPQINMITVDTAFRETSRSLSMFLWVTASSTTVWLYSVSRLQRCGRRASRSPAGYSQSLALLARRGWR